MKLSLIDGLVNFLGRKAMSEELEEHRCDKCNVDSEELWTAEFIDGDYCFKCFRLAHDDIEEFDEWCKKFINSTG